MGICTWSVMMSLLFNIDIDWSVMMSLLFNIDIDWSVMMSLLFNIDIDWSVMMSLLFNIDIDECQVVGGHNCSENATCADTHGSYSCTCNPGYEGTGIKCLSKKIPLV